MPRIELDSAIEELYSAPREEFIPLRRRLVKDARAAGDTATAAEIEKLAKPTTAAWVANQLARAGAAEAHELAELGDALRVAHEQLNGAELKSLTHKRTELVGELLRLAGQRHAPSESVLRELEEILTRVVADSAAAAAFVSGRLTSAKGFAPTAGWPAVPADPGPPARSATPARSAERGPKAAESRRERARLALEDARAAVKEAEAARADDERALTDAETAVAEAAEEVRRLGEELDAAEAREKRARGLAAMARRSVKEAERRAAQAWHQVQQAELRLTELDEG